MKTNPLMYLLVLNYSFEEKRKPKNSFDFSKFGIPKFCLLLGFCGNGFTVIQLFDNSSLHCCKFSVSVNPKLIISLFEFYLLVWKKRVILFWYWRQLFFFDTNWGTFKIHFYLVKSIHEVTWNFFPTKK